MDTIVLNEQDPKFKYDIASRPGAENFKLCFTCGTCTASCPVAEVNEDYDPRKIIRMSIFGMRKDVLSSDIIWMCQRCYICYARCPQNVKFADVMGAIRDMAVEEGYAPKERIEQIEELDRFAQDLRCNLVKQMIKPDDKRRKNIESMLAERLK
ncbi:heterodisulfide reductase [bacterium]|nr:MAG: heterodisulfide reductase [bacterium]